MARTSTVRRAPAAAPAPDAAPVSNAATATEIHGLAWRLPSKAIKAICEFASDDEARPHIAAVLFDGIFVVATDGHMLVKIPALPTVSGKARRTYLVDTATLRRAVSAAGPRGEIECAISEPVNGVIRGVFHCYVRLPGARSGMSRDAVTVPWVDAQTLSGTAFPPYDQVIPAFDADPEVDGESCVTGKDAPRASFRGIGFNVALLARCVPLVDALAPDRPLVYRGASGPLAPMVYTFDLRLDHVTERHPDLPADDARRMATVVLMPMRV